MPHHTSLMPLRHPGQDIWASACLFLCHVADLLTLTRHQVSIVANYIKERTKNAQFIVISLRNNMFELAARLVGVYKVNHMTKSVTIENKDYIARPPTAGGNGGGIGGSSSQQQHTQRTGFIGGGGGLTSTLALR